MAVYFSASRLREALESFKNTRVKQGRLFDFLIVKRTMKLKGDSAVAITQSEPAYIAALDELGGIKGLEGEIYDDQHPYLNFFCLEERKLGYRGPKYKSNGTNTTIAGSEWQRDVIEFDGSVKPRKASFKEGYDAYLDKLLFTSNNKRALPNLSQVAVWYFRGQDLSGLIGESEDPTQIVDAVTKEFVDRVGLTESEIERVFDNQTVLESRSYDEIFACDPPNPEQYLPQNSSIKIRVEEASEARVSFDLVASLAAKRFVILTGPSGTGKSMSALTLAEGVQASYPHTTSKPVYELIPVGPDWTSPKKVIGYKTPFGKERKQQDGSTTNETYEITSTVRLLLRAYHPSMEETPHFLIFDEMNLSHVERYFAPFLSLMEAQSIITNNEAVGLLENDELSLVLEILEESEPESLEAESAKHLIESGQKLSIPNNVCIVGTVNVDETTYMFSPKVLDRAHVVELSAEKPSSYCFPYGSTFANASSIPVKAAADFLSKRFVVSEADMHSVDVVDLSKPFKVEGVSDSVATQIKNDAVSTLDGMYELLNPVGFSFGYRVVKEVFEYITSWVHLRLSLGDSEQDISSTWYSALDNAILQKVLPKIHGNRRLLGESLNALEAFIIGGDVSSEPTASYSLGGSRKIFIPDGEGLHFNSDGQLLSRSRAKVREMASRLDAIGYVSFVS